MLFKLAFRNVKRQWSNYLIYFITVSLTVAIVFALDNIIFGDALRELFDNTEYLDRSFIEGIKSALFVLIAVLIVIIAFVLGYATSFLLRKRKKEFGLYLTLGMTKGNVLTIFAGEMTVTFLLSLGFGVLIGLGVFQFTFFILSNFLEIPYEAASYSSDGTIVTVIIVGAIFLFSSVVSLFYLGYAKIARLLQAEQTVEKTVKHPFRWFVVALISLAVLIASVCSVTALFDDLTDTRFPSALTYGIAVCFLSVVLFLFALSKSLIPFLLSKKRFSARNIRTFTLRQLSAKLTGNSVMAGILAVLLSVVIIGSNVFLSVFRSFEMDDKIKQPYDATLLYDEETPLGVPEGLNRYGTVETYYAARIYQSYDLASENRSLLTTLQHGDMYGTSCITESDYNGLRALLGYRPISLNGGFFLHFQYANPNVISHVSKLDLSRAELKIEQNRYSYSGFFDCRVELINGSYRSDLYFVIPDDVPEKASPSLSFQQTVMPVVYRDHTFDKDGLLQFRQELVAAGYYTDIRISGSFRSYMLMIAAPWLLIDLFLSATFLLLSVAILALKVLTGISEEKERYKTLWKLGASEGMLGRSLFLQIFFYFFFPLGVPLFLNIPLSSVCSILALQQGIYLSALDLFGQLMSVTGLILAIYIPYFLVCFFTAKRDVGKLLTRSF